MKTNTNTSTTTRLSLASLALALLLLAAFAPDASAQCGARRGRGLFGRRAYRPQQAPAAYGYGFSYGYGYVSPDPAAPQQAAAPTATPQAVGAGDAAGFVAMLNAERTARGLAPVAWDVYAESICIQNNAHQLGRGLGHHILGNLAQCAAVGIHDARSALASWLGSPAHAAILLAPGLRSCGYSQSGSCHTAAGSFGY